jgi:hypothetical protein
MVSYATRHIVKEFAEALYWQIIQKYWNTAIQRNYFWSIAYEAHTIKILKDVC